MPHVGAALHFMRQHDAVHGVRSRLRQPRRPKHRVISLRHRAPLLVPAVDVLQLHAENGSLEPVHARIPADLVVVVAAPHPVLAQHSQALGNLIGVGRHHAGIARRAQVLGGIEAERRHIAQSAGLPPLPLRAPRLGGILDELQSALSSKTSKTIPVDSLAVQMHRQNGPDRVRRAVESSAASTARGIQVECRGIDVRQHRVRARSQNCADRGKEAEWGGDDRTPGPDPDSRERQPQRIGSRRAAHRVGHAQRIGGSRLESRNRIPQNELPRIQNPGQRFQQFLAEGRILPLQIQHRNGLRRAVSAEAFNGFFTRQCYQWDGNRPAVMDGSVRLCPKPGQGCPS